MRNGPKAAVVQTVGTLFHLGATGEWSDGDLLERFVAREDETRSAAFEVLVDRHGPMVLDVCRNVLRDAHDAEDAFQATFLILAKQARSIRQRSSVGSWLFGVATRVASRAKVDAARRRARERAFAVEGAVRGSSDSDETEAVKAALHEEIARLPEKYRAPLVLCHLEGISYETAAARLGCPVGTVSVRLMRAREKLRDRLMRRGEPFAAAAGTASPAVSPDRQPVAPALVASVADRATDLIAGRLAGADLLPSSISNLIREVTMSMFARDLAARAAGALIVGSLLVGSGVRGYQAMVQGSHPAMLVTQPPRDELEPPKEAAEDRAVTILHWVDSMQQLGKIGSAINGFHNANGFLPPAAIRDASTGKPLLSWRVAILPWIGSRDLYQQFHLKEAWDSPHNKTLIAKMPYEYAPLGLKPKEPFTTFHQVFVGPGTAFEALPNNGKVKLTSVRDGAANTLAVVDAASAVPWTKPEDLLFQPDQPLPPLGGSFKDGFNLVCLDGSVFSFARNFDERLLKGMITRSGGEPISRNQLHQGPLVRSAKNQEAEAQLKVAKQAVEAIDQLQTQGQPASPEVQHRWSLRLLESQRAISPTKVEEVAALERYIARTKKLMENALAFYRTGQLSFLQYLETEYWHNEAAAWLEKAKDEVHDPARR